MRDVSYQSLEPPTKQEREAWRKWLGPLPHGTGTKWAMHRLLDALDDRDARLAAAEAALAAMRGAVERRIRWNGARGTWDCGLCGEWHTLKENLGHRPTCLILELDALATDAGRPLLGAVKLATAALSASLSNCPGCGGAGFEWEGEEIDALSVVRVDCGLCSLQRAAIESLIAAAPWAKDA